jgi:DNA-binding beta-propeller fold protein YncE
MDVSELQEFAVANPLSDVRVRSDAVSRTVAFLERAMNKLPVAVLIILLGNSSGMSQAMKPSGDISPLVLESKIPLGAVAGRIDHMAIDVDRLRLFVAELGNDTVAVVSLADAKVIHVIDGLQEPQGVRYVPSVDALYVANAGDGAVGIYEGPNYALKDRLDLGDDADNIRFDPATNQIFVGYGSGGIAVIDALARRRILNITLSGHPEGFQLAGDGDRIFVNVPTSREIAVIDRRAGKQVAKWDLRYHGNFPMALDEQGQRVFVGFRSPPRIAVYSMRDGTALAAVEVCGDTDDVFFDPKRARIYVSCGEGLLDVLESRDGNYRVVARIPTSPGSRTALFSPEKDRLFLAVRATPVEPAAIWIFRPNP